MPWDSPKRRFARRINNQYQRDDWVISQLRALPSGLRILDAGAGSQRYRDYCSHLNYVAQDFAQYVTDELAGFPWSRASEIAPYAYGPLDHVCDITRIAEKDASFDVVLCTEVLEHVPYPVDALRELHRLLKPNGTLILTAPSNSLRHMDPYYFTSGFSDRWFERVLTDIGMTIDILAPVGDYYSWMGVEVVRTARNHSILAKVLVATAGVYFLSKRVTAESRNTLCFGYHVRAVKTQ